MTFTQGQAVEICPFNVDGYPNFAAYDGQSATVLGMRGQGQVRVRVAHRDRPSQELLLPAEALKPLEDKGQKK